MRIRCGRWVDGLVESVGGDVARDLVGKVVMSIEEASIRSTELLCALLKAAARYRCSQAIFIFC